MADDKDQPKVWIEMAIQGELLRDAVRPEFPDFSAGLNDAAASAWCERNNKAQDAFERNLEAIIRPAFARLLSNLHTLGEPALYTVELSATPYVVRVP